MLIFNLKYGRFYASKCAFLGPVNVRAQDWPSKDGLGDHCSGPALPHRGCTDGRNLVTLLLPPTRLREDRPYTNTPVHAKRAQPKWLNPSRRQLKDWEASLPCFVQNLAAYGTAVYVNVATNWKPVTETVTVPAPTGQPNGRK